MYNRYYERLCSYDAEPEYENDYEECLICNSEIWKGENYFGFSDKHVCVECFEKLKERRL